MRNSTLGKNTLIGRTITDMALTINVRKPQFKFDSSVPRHWLAQSPFRTHLCNSFTLLFPTGEKFFIRSLQKFVPTLQDATLQQEAKLFIRQEAQHALEHDKFLTNLREQGYEIDGILRLVEDVITRFVESKTSDEFRLALTAGFEHLTSLLAEIGLEENFFEDAHPQMKALFEWHALEEIEHRSVAFDVLQSVDKSYLRRAAGLMSAYLILSGLTGYVTANLLWQDKVLLKKTTLREGLNVFILEHALLPKAMSIFARYLRPGFHPGEQNLEALVKRLFPDDVPGVA